MSELFSDREIHWGDQGPTRVAEIGETDMWCGRGRGKRRNRSTEDMTGYRNHIGKEEWLGLTDRLVDRFLVGSSTMKQGFDINKKGLRILGFPTILEVGFHRWNGMVLVCFCV